MGSKWCIREEWVKTKKKKVKVLHDILQVIIDDANACTEPETLIPLILHKNVDQVVMLGDTKQLDPYVINETAKRMGLGTPLMNSYLDIAVNLIIQYRVVS